MTKFILARCTLTLGIALLPVIGFSNAADITDAGGEKSAAEQSGDVWQRKTLTGDWGGRRKSLEDAGVTFAVNEQSELWASLFGGMRAGVACDGLTTASLKLDLAKLVDWKGATFFVNGYQIHGRGPTVALVGSQQLISSIEATPSTKLYQLWIEQSLFDDQVNIRIGQEGANDELMTSQSAQLFLNGSFGYPDLLERDLPSEGPNYPLATPMVRAKVKIDDRLTYVGAIFNGDPAGPGPGDPQLRDASGTAFRLNDPPLIFNEFWYRVGDDKPSAPLPGTYKVGAWVHTGEFGLSRDNMTGLPVPFALLVPLFRGDFAVYGLADQMIWRKAGTRDEGITVFGLAIGAPNDRNFEDFFIEGGFNWKGLIKDRPQDLFGMAFAFAHTSEAFRRLGEESIALTGSGKLFASNETVLEATYLYQISPWWSVQPDIQYVFNPGASLPATHAGISVPYKDSLTIGVRTKVDF